MHLTTMFPDLLGGVVVDAVNSDRFRIRLRISHLNLIFAGFNPWQCLDAGVDIANKFDGIHDFVCYVSWFTSQICFSKCGKNSIASVPHTFKIALEGTGSDGWDK